MGSLCPLPLSSMESAFHFICGTTGSAVCLDCFAWVALVDSLLCTCTLGVVPSESVGGGPIAVWCRCLGCANLFQSSGVCGLSMWLLNL